jgi:hypothetical protein
VLASSSGLAGAVDPQSRVCAGRERDRAAVGHLRIAELNAAKRGGSTPPTEGGYGGDSPGVAEFRIHFPASSNAQLVIIIPQVNN